MMRTGIASLGLVLALASLTRADDCGCTHKHEECAPGFKKECVFEPHCEPKMKKCWEFEKKDICIPRVRFPWQCCDTPPKCRVKTVCVPKPSSKQCGTVIKWKCKVYEVPCETTCGTHSSCTGEQVIVCPAPVGKEILPKAPSPVTPRK